jgi:hypothetical protein
VEKRLLSQLVHADDAAKQRRPLPETHGDVKSYQCNLIIVIIRISNDPYLNHIFSSRDLSLLLLSATTPFSLCSQERCPHIHSSTLKISPCLGLETLTQRKLSLPLEFFSLRKCKPLFAERPSKITSWEKTLP